MKVCGRRTDTDEVVTLTTSGGKIVDIETGECSPDIGGPDVWVSPGFCDLQINGYAGHDFNRDFWGSGSEVSNDVYPIYQRAAEAGTTLLCPTVVTNSFESMRDSLVALARALSTDSGLAGRTPGIHVEGPYLSAEDGPRGAHPKAHLRDPDWDEFRRFQEAADGRIRLFTIAPERCGGIPFIEKLVASGVTVSLGHTAADTDTIRAAVSAGAAMSTHLGNGAHGMIRRHPNYIWDQLAEDGLTASVIADGHHLPPSVLKVFARVKQAERLILVSDAVSLGGLPPGQYTDGLHEVSETGKVSMAGTPYLAGAGHLLDTCVANALRCMELSVDGVMSTVTVNPARLLGLGEHKGRLEIGYDADLTLFRIPEVGPIQVVATVCGGETLYNSKS